MRNALLLGVATLAVASAPAQAADILFASSGNTASSQTVAEGGVTQIRMDSGAVVSIVGPAEFSLEGETITLANGGVTVAGPGASGVVLRLPGGAEATVTGSGSLAVRNGQLSGNVMGGTMQVRTGAATRTYRPGQNWAATVGGSSSRVVANAAQPSPNGSARGSPFATTRQTIAQAAMNGLAVTLGEGLAGVGASGDVVAAARGVEAYLANPALVRLPSGDVDRLLAYSDRLAAALGGGSSFEGASPALVNAYLQYLANNGQIGEFQSAYASLVTQYLTLLANGGLASDFAGADLSQLNSYIDYLQLTGQLGRIGAAQQTLLSAYLSYLRGGGLPDAFVVPANILGEDAIAAYVAAVEAYVAFLQSGGVPSEYAGLSAKVFQAYLEALSSAGLFDTLLAGQADFLNAYLAFLQNGGNIDDFDQLPQTFTFPVPEGQLASNQFMALRGSKGELAPYNGQIDRSRSDVIYDDTTGSPLYFKYGTTRAAIGEAELIEAGRISAGGVSWGRWVNGTAYAQANTELDLGANGIHVIAGPMVTNMPTTGLIEYDFAGGTNPTLTGGEVGSLSVAKAAVSFGSTTRVGAELKTDFSDRSYTLQTVGGIAQTAQNGIALREDLAPGFFFGEVRQTTGGLIEVIGTGAACQGAGGCKGEIRGYISGDEGAELAISYIARDPSGAEVLGTAGFAKGDPLVIDGVDPQAGTLWPDVSVDVGYLGAKLGRESTSDPLVYVNGAGQIVGYDMAQYENERVNAGSATLADTGSAAHGAVRWARFTDGTLVGEFYERDLDVSANGGFHILAGIPTATLPSTGAVLYDFAGGTAPTAASGNMAPGTFTGQASVLWGAEAKLGLTASVAIGDDSYDISTPGGVTIPSLSPVEVLNFTEPRISGFYAITSSGAACPQGDCGVSLSGSVYGDDAAALGFLYNIGGTDGDTVTGAAAFTKAGAGSGGGGGGGQSGGAVGPDTSGPGVTIAANGSYDLRSAYANDDIRAIFLANGPLVLDNLNRPQTIGTVGFNSNYVQNIDASHYEVAGTADWVLGRYSDGSVTIRGTDRAFSENQGFHYAVSIGAENVVFPTEGYAIYDLEAATAPTFATGVTAPGTFSGQFAVGYGSQLKGAIDASIVMPGDTTYSVATPGGLANVLTSGRNLAGATGFTMSEFFSGNGGLACPSGQSCELRLNGSFTGDEGETITMSYQLGTLFANPTNNYLVGAAVFGRNSEGVVTPTPTGGVEEVTPGGDQIVLYSATTIGIDSRNSSSVTYDSTTGAPLAYVWELNSSTAENERPTIGSNTQNDSGSVADVIGWTRWAGGTTGGRYFNDQDGIEMPADGGWHIVAGDPATNLPTSGTVQYALVGSTAPTIRDGSMAPGTFSGELAVAFGATPKVGIEFDVAIGGNSYAINTPGGVADPMNGGMGVETSGQYAMTFGASSFDNVAVTGSGPVCSGSGACNADIRGFLSGDGASHVGVVYTFGNAGFDQQIDGSAVFGMSVP
ncbi:hypothetical protein [Aurantiacibacter flavus]|uniref:DUF3739 domain-containing protein n=1 Tax=Aurantiacibacter flavus TaxID=3145232 RepID=A0ABV0CSQ3_9SPHN